MCRFRFIVLWAALALGNCEGTDSPDLLERFLASGGEDLFKNLVHRPDILRWPQATRLEQERRSLAVLAKPRVWQGYDMERFSYSAHDWRRFEAIVILGELKSRRAVATLIAIATEPVAKDNRERWLATRALARMSCPDAIPHFISLMSHYNVNTRFWSRLGLVKAAGIDLGADEQPWRDWWLRKSGQHAPTVAWPWPHGVTLAERRRALESNFYRQDQRFVAHVERLTRR